MHIGRDKIRRPMLRRWIGGSMLLALLVGWWFFLPDPLFRVPYSTVILDRDDEIMGMTVAEDGQFRVSGRGHLSAKYVAALLCFEDKRFWAHEGVDPWAIARALFLNVRSGSVVSGGSTLTMQVVRLSRENPPRTIPEKILEMFLALRLEQSFNKWEILNMYVDHAPFGGNIVGIQAAALKYFNRQPDELSWAEAALLAVLPNAPALMYPGKNMPELKAKRDKLLRELSETGYFGEDDLAVATAEPLPERIYSPECIAPHLLAKAYKQRRGQINPTFIDARLQERVNEIVARHIDVLKHNHIYNAAVLVAHIPTGEVRAYVGNSPKVRENGGNQVDIITSNRSSGSILKPALYALMQQSGYILPGCIVSDVPSRFGGYTPSNFNKEFQGVVPAAKALSMSLNIPFVRLLREYGVEHFYDDLKKMGITTLNRRAENYGLSLILGGAECKLWDVCNMYGGMASILRHYSECDGASFDHEFRRLRVWGDERADSTEIRQNVVTASAVWLTFKALRDVERPDLESGWKNFASSMNLSWKTGTSFGFRDAWAVGVNPEYVVGVWVGNADGEGRPGLIGVRAAAPILFEVASLLRTDEHFFMPREELVETAVCRKSGYRASDICPERDTVWIARAGEKTAVCPYHRLVNLDLAGKFRVDSECESVNRMKIEPWFVLSPVQEWYYARTHADYKKLPPYRADCQRGQDDVMEMIYPQRGLRVFIPKDLGGVVRGVIFEMAHREPSMLVYWHIDDQFLGTTRYHHQLEVNVSPGRHVLHLVDAKGNTLRQGFVVVDGSEDWK
ncbi:MULTISPECIES: penicillin-binding protein 1C [Butyricimonas]|uniref:penicillin-binding protein 1C n=1 Tax=Butyricimonas TaxID=574697 RepID=UPI000AFA6D04|nr:MULTISPECIES: penicillin-binding protein 1C [Butyricimonas]